MKTHPCWEGLVLFAVLTISCGAKEKWIHAQTEHFNMYSEASENESREFLNELEQFRSAFHQIFHLPRIGGPPVTVIMFGYADQMEPFQALYKGKPKAVVGYYHRDVDEDIIVLSAETENRGGNDDNVILHEYVHRMLREQNYRPPTWLDEGLAVFYATMRVTKDSAIIGQPAQRRLKLISHNAIMPLDKLFAVTHSSPSYNEEQQSGVFYAESWLLVHYLICGANKNTQGKFPEFINAVNGSPEKQEARFREVFGMSYSEMESELRVYMNGGRFQTALLKLPIGDFSEKIHFEPVGEVERDSTLENLRWRVRPEEANPARMLELAERDLNAARPYEVLGAYTLVKGHDRPRALDFWRNAVERNSNNAYVYLQLAKDQLRDIIAAPSIDFRAPVGVTVPIRKYLDRAVELRPDYLEAWEALAQIEAYAEKPRAEVITRVESILPMMHSKASTLAALALVRWRARDFKTCGLMLEELKACAPSHSTAAILMNRLNERLAQSEQPKKTEDARELNPPAKND
jgi:tetratricopeptide (TPR) repeat protein